MSTVVQQVGADFFEALDFDHVPGCDGADHAGAALPARWRLHTALPCGHSKTKLLCDPCAVKVRNRLDRMRAGFDCQHCDWGSVGSEDPWRYVRLEPLS